MRILYDNKYALPAKCLGTNTDETFLKGLETQVQPKTKKIPLWNKGSGKYLTPCRLAELNDDALLYKLATIINQHN